MASDRSYRDTPSESVGPAAFGTLDPEVVRDVTILREFDQNRQRHFARLFGGRLRRSPLRDEIIRLLMISFGAGRHERIAFYVRTCADFATEPSVRQEIEHLDAAKLVCLQSDPDHPRALLVAPTQKLVEFYNHQMPRLRAEAARLL